MYTLGATGEVPLGIEYRLIVPPESRDAVAAVLAQQLPELMRQIDPESGSTFPNVYANPVDDGLYLCDTLSNRAVAAEVMRRAIDLLLLHAPSVTVVDG
jgi:hypothetical protein